ncbi:MAG: hypothetical protein RLY78_101 [Pseudomonadota bacterium]
MSPPRTGQPPQASTPPRPLWCAGLPGIDPQRHYDDAMRAALLRLHASRLQLVAVLLPEPAAARPQGRAALKPAAWWRWLRAQLRRSALTSVVSDSLRHLWRHHPWRPAADTLHDTLAPAVRQHPWVAVALSAGLGAAVVAARPWQWPVLAPHLAAAPRQAGHWALQELGQRLAPLNGLQGWVLTAVGSGLARQVAAAVLSSGPPADDARGDGRPQVQARQTDVNANTNADTKADTLAGGVDPAGRTGPTAPRHG